MWYHHENTVPLAHRENTVPREKSDGHGRGPAEPATMQVDPVPQKMAVDGAETGVGLAASVRAIIDYVTAAVLHTEF